MSIVVQTRLPPQGADWLQERLWEPLFNLIATPGRRRDAQGRLLFPLEGLVSAASSKPFLACLGRPLVIADSLESRPGVWWLVDARNRMEWLIWSDSHRRNAWKGGQLCLLAPRRSPLASLGQLAFDTRARRHFEERSAQGRAPSWPRGHTGVVVREPAIEPRQQRRALRTGR